MHWREFSKAIGSASDIHHIEGQKVLNTARGVCIEEWTDRDLEEAWKIIGKAYRAL